MCKKLRLFEDFEDNDTAEAVPTDEVTQYLACCEFRVSQPSLYWTGGKHMKQNCLRWLKLLNKFRQFLHQAFLANALSVLQG